MCVTQVTVDTSISTSPVCHSVEMDVHIGHLDLCGASFLSLPDSEPIRESHSSVSTQILTYAQLYAHKNHISLFMVSLNLFSYWRVNCLTPAFLTFGLRPAWLPRLTECVGRRVYTHGHPTKVSSTYQQVKNLQMLLQIPRNASLHLLLDRYISSEGKRRWLSSGWPRPFQLRSRFHWTKRSPRWGPTFRKSMTTNWQLPWHCLVRNCWHKCIHCIFFQVMLYLLCTSASPT